MPVNGESKLRFDSIEDTITAFRKSPQPPKHGVHESGTVTAVLPWTPNYLIKLSWKSGCRAKYVHWLIVHAIGNGEFIVVLDSTDRENEGDLIIAAEDITTQKMAFMVRYTR